jgi:hypothetical protein
MQKAPIIVAILLASFANATLAQEISPELKEQTSKYAGAMTLCMIDYVEPYLRTRETAGALVDASISTCQEKFDDMRNFLLRTYVDPSAAEEVQLDQTAMVDKMVEAGNKSQRSLILSSILEMRREHGL